MFSKHTRFVNFEHNTMKPQDYKYIQPNQIM